MTIKKYAVPAGVTSITLPDGSVLIPVAASCRPTVDTNLNWCGQVRSDDSLYLLVPLELWQSGIPFVLPGDGGTNGLNFTGTGGFHAVGSDSGWRIIRSMLGGYLPRRGGQQRGGGGRYSESDTAGTFSGNDPGLDCRRGCRLADAATESDGRADPQTISEITALSGTQTGACSGQTIIRGVLAQRANSSAGGKFSVQAWRNFVK